MKIFVIGDPHFKNSNIDDMDILTSKILEKVIQTKPDLIVILGDVLDRHSNIQMTPLNRAITFFENLQKYAKLYILIGNHDRKNNQDFLSDEHPFPAVHKWNNVFIVNKPIIHKINGYIMTFVPYVPPGRFLEALNYVEGWNHSKCIFAHQEFYGCKNGTIFSLVGDKWDENYPLCISGHIHDYCELQENIIYVGTPLQNSYGEKLDKTISIFNFDQNSYTHERIDLRIAKKIMHEITFDQIMNYDLSYGDHHKLIIVGSNHDLKDINKHPNIIKWKKQGAIIIKKIVQLKKDKSFKINTNRINFIDTLRNKIEKDEILLQIFEKEFGSFTKKN